MRAYLIAIVFGAVAAVVVLGTVAAFNPKLLQKSPVNIQVNQAENTSVKGGDEAPPTASSTVSAPPVLGAENLKVESAGDSTYWVTNPTSNSRLFVTVLQPETPSTTALVLVPGGSDASSAFLSRKMNAQVLADAGYTVVLFDPNGRGQSQGTEDENGTIGQDGLNAVTTFAATIEGVQRVGVVSFSYGIALAAGMLARYQNIPVAFLIDWEGPANREEIDGGCGKVIRGTQNPSCDDEEYWSQREAENFIGKVTVPYQRLQTETDHAQPDYSHTVAMVNAAVAGDVPWVRLNTDAPGQTYTLSSVHPLSDSFDREMMTGILEYINYLATTPVTSM